MIFFLYWLCRKKFLSNLIIPHKNVPKNIKQQDNFLWSLLCSCFTLNNFHNHQITFKSIFNYSTYLRSSFSRCTSQVVRVSHYLFEFVLNYNYDQYCGTPQELFHHLET